MSTKIKTMHRYVTEELKKEKWQSKQKWIAYPLVAKDLVSSTKKYHIHPDEYLQLDFYSSDDKRRESIVSRKERDAYVKLFNKKEITPKLENKIEFLTHFKDYVNRDFLIIRDASFEDYVSFISRHPAYIAKQSDSGQGKGVEMVSEVKDPETEFKRLKDHSFDLIEEIIEIHPELKDLSPGGISPIRFITYVDENSVPHIIFTAINMSTGSQIVNFNSGAVISIINADTGELMNHALDKKNKMYELHPVTGKPIKGFKLPEWDALKALVLDAAVKFPEVGYIGWDTTITANGPCIIEANAKRPAINGLQMEGFKGLDEQYGNFKFVREEYKRRKG
ncbi:putative hexapeptide transferase family protein [Alkalibacterium sp. AK22]|uniref:sugar-transfer associated ATP-grasp domain-containing protein n=1 Tax=Alkalibacterium sp. AK22 TaxID=1229520 RepID=UPI0004465C6A|nr:sugar-transfer associated ATP-grasp domain-containing protein [Alkalibacterium sp. AK22]EXJ23330.1 putative hexapeptide transferase family protein [Alkalibacterium sp. AK22]